MNSILDSFFLLIVELELLGGPARREILSPEHHSVGNRYIAWKRVGYRRGCGMKLSKKVVHGIKCSE